MNTNIPAPVLLASLSYSMLTGKAVSVAVNNSDDTGITVVLIGTVNQIEREDGSGLSFNVTNSEGRTFHLRSLSH